MQIECLITIKTNLTLLNTKKINLNNFIVNTYDSIYELLGKVPKIDKDEMRSIFIEHLLDNEAFLKFDSEHKFVSYLFKFVRNQNMNELRRINKFTELDEAIAFKEDTSSKQELTIKMYIKETGLNITELAKILNVTRQQLYNYIELNAVPYNIKRKLIKYKGFHDPITRANEIKERIFNEYGSLKYEIFKSLGIDRQSIFIWCKKGISYTKYCETIEKLENSKRFGKNE